MKFLTGASIQEEIVRLVGHGADLSVAVAYWGDGGASHTGIAKRNDAARANVRILCDLHSGACNPFEIAKLRQCDDIVVKTLNDLHAKVWICQSTVIVGSANASTSGLADETQLGSKVEAALVVDDRKLAVDLLKWFNEKWNNRAAKIVDEVSLSKAKDLWKKRRRLARKAAAEHSTEQPTNNPSELKRKLIRRVADVAEELWRSDDSKDITLRSVRRCQEDPEWHRDYEAYLNDNSATTTDRKGDLH
ncbi:MAG: phospholipase D-like domain-containing protein, partial [Candidatus Tectomicrobia bacterium]|nr:phospholipase D-like domain-containing protein [Candidatus Tectomicrobia bacterium]